MTDRCAVCTFSRRKHDRRQRRHERRKDHFCIHQFAQVAELPYPAHPCRWGADHLVSEIIRVRQEQVGPDEDPGDMTIVIQDDSALTTVQIDGLFGLVGVGGSIDEALQNALDQLKLRSV